MQIKVQLDKKCVNPDKTYDSFRYELIRGAGESRKLLSVRPNANLR